LLTKATADGSAITFTGRTGNYNKQLIVDTCRMGAYVEDTDGYWDIPISLASASQTFITNNTIMGSSPNVRCTNGIKLNVGNDVHIHNNTIGYADIGVNVVSGGGVLVNFNQILAVVDGVVKEGGENYLDVSHNHIVPARCGVEIKTGTTSNHNKISFNFVLMYDSITGYTTTDFFGFDVSGDSNKIIGNEVLRTTGDNPRWGCIVRAGANNNVIQSNVWNALNYGVEIEATADNTYVYDNIEVGGISFANQCVSNKVRGLRLSNLLRSNFFRLKKVSSKITRGSFSKTSRHLRVK
jgi:hypothetical protein